MVIDPAPHYPRTFYLDTEQSDTELEQLRQAMQGQPLGYTTSTPDGTPATVVTAETAHALEVGIAELNRRERRARARAERRAARR